ncbi:hypothetical protein [Brevibacillus sp. SAFN-007a]
MNIDVSANQDAYVAAKLYDKAENWQADGETHPCIRIRLAR